MSQEMSPQRSPAPDIQRDSQLAADVQAAGAIPAAPTFHRPIPNRASLTQATPASARIEAPGQTHNPAYMPGSDLGSAAQYGNQPTPLQPGGAGPLAAFNRGQAPAHEPSVTQGQASATAYDPTMGGMDSTPAFGALPAGGAYAPAAVTTDPSLDLSQDPSSATTPAGAYAAMSSQAFQQPGVRPSFPAAPSKVLAEQYAKGGDGHIVQPHSLEDLPSRDQAMASAHETMRLEGVYAPPATGPKAMGEAGVQVGEAGPSPRPRPRLQHMDPDLHAHLAGAGEPNLSEMTGMQARATTASEVASASPIAHTNVAASGVGAAALGRVAQPQGAFWTFQVGGREDRRDHGTLVWFLIFLAVLVLICLLGFGAWSQYRSLSVPGTPLIITAQRARNALFPQIQVACRLRGRTSQS